MENTALTILTVARGDLLKLEEILRQLSEDCPKGVHLFVAAGRQKSKPCAKILIRAPNTSFAAIREFIALIKGRARKKAENMNLKCLAE